MKRKRDEREREREREREGREILREKEESGLRERRRDKFERKMTNGANNV